MTKGEGLVAAFKRDITNHPCTHGDFADLARRIDEALAEAAVLVPHRESCDPRALIERCAGVAEKFYPRAHTYASENADRYIAQDEACKDIAAAIRALK